MSLAPDLQDLLGLDAAPTAPVLTAEPPPAGSAVPAGGDVMMYGSSGAYDGGGRDDQLALWAPAIQSPDAEILPDKDTLDARTRDMLRNDSHIAGAATTHKDNIVGAVYLLNAKPMTKELFGKDDEIWEREFQEEVETKFTLWAESNECWIDAQRVKTLTDYVRLAVGVDLAGGEVLSTAEWMPDDGRPFRTAVQMVDCDRLATPYISLNSQKIRGGVERDRYGAPIAYHIRNGHPSDWMDSAHYQFRRVMARKPWGRPMVLHSYEQLRPDQSRGISAMVSAIPEMKMMKGFRKVELQRAILAATYAASMESELPHADVMRMLGDGVDQASVTEYMRTYLEAVAEFSGGAKNLKIDGVKIPVLPPGTSLNLANPGADSPAGDKFEASVLRYLASATGVSYEQLSKDYSQISYATGRMSKGHTENHMAARKKRVADRAANFVYQLWLEEAINRNVLETLKRARVPNFYEGLNAEAYCSAEWIGAGAPMIDPLKETQAFALQLKYALTSKESVIARVNGGDWRRVSKQIAREMKNDENLGIPSVYAMAMSDAENALSGTPQERENDGSQADGQ